jgi:hypothetical protein
VLDSAEDVGRLQKFFRRDASDVEACSPKDVVFDEPDIEPNSSAIERSGVTAWSTANYYDIM